MTEQLPASPDAERFVLGAILLDYRKFSQAVLLRPEDFHLHKNSVIFRRMQDLDRRQERIDKLTVFNELSSHNEQSQVDGLSYLVSLDEGMPNVKDISSWVRILKEKAALRRLVLIGQRTIASAMADEHKPLVIVRGLSQKLTRIDMDLDDRKTSLTAGEIVEEHGGINNFMLHAIKPGISSGFPQWDEATLGLQEGCHYIIGGRTGSGKTSLAINIGINVARKKFPVHVFSLEMSKEILMYRAISSISEVPFKAIVRNDLLPSQRAAMKQALDELMELPFYVDDDPSLSLPELGSRWDRAVQEHEARLVLVDYLQIINPPPEERGMSEYDLVTWTSKVCRMKARQHKHSSIALSQLRRASGGKKNDAERPTLGELKASGGIENDAAAVCLVHRPEMFKPGDPDLRGKAEWIFAKTRVSGLKTAHTEYQGRFFKFVDHGEQANVQAEDD